MKKEVTNFKRQELFDHYNSKVNPFSTVTTRIDITNIYNFCKTKKNYYATIGYFLTKAMNQIDEFKYSYENGKIIKGDVIHPSYVEMKEDQTIGFFTCDYDENYDVFIQNYLKTKNDFYHNDAYIEEEKDDAVVWLSCEPWFNFTGLIPPFDKKEIVPQLIWDKFIFEGDHCYVNLMIMIHHGFADGFHIGLLINKINEVIASIEG